MRAFARTIENIRVAPLFGGHGVDNALHAAKLAGHILLLCHLRHIAHAW